MQNDSYQPYPESEQPQPPVQPQYQGQPNIPPQPMPRRPQFAPQPQPQMQMNSGPQSTSKLPKILGVLGIVVLVLLALIGGYLLRDQTGKQAVVPTTTTTKSTPHTVTAVGYPGGTTDIVTTKIGIGADMQAIESPTTKGNPGIISQFSNSTNDEMGRWMIGNPENTVGGSVGDVTMINLVRNTYFDIPVPKGFHPIKQSPGYELQIANTPYAKSSALKSYIARITKCAGDASTGIVVSDFMNICVTPQVIPSNTKNSFNSEAVIEGYGKSGDEEFIMLGTIALESSDDLTPAHQKQISDEYQAAVDTATADSSTPALPDYVTKRTAAIRDALAYTTVTIENTAK